MYLVTDRHAEEVERLLQQLSADVSVSWVSGNHHSMLEKLVGIWPIFAPQSFSFAVVGSDRLANCMSLATALVRSTDLPGSGT